MPKVVGFVVKTSLRVEHALVMKVFASVTKVYCIYPHFNYIIINILTIATVYYIVVDARLYLSQTEKQANEKFVFNYTSRGVMITVSVIYSQ